MIQQKAYKFRIYPNKTQTILLNKTFGCVRYAWNSWVEKFNKKEKAFKTPKEFKQELKWMTEISSAAIQQKERDFKQFKQQFFNKSRKKELGKPKFKCKDRKQSYRLPNQKFSLDQDLKRIRLEKIGKVKVILDRTIPEDVKFLSVTVSKDLVGDYFISIAVEENIEQKNKTAKKVGVDLGIKDFAILSTGEKFGSPQFFRESQSEIKKLSQHLSRKKKGSNHRKQIKVKLAKTHRKIDRQRDFFLHQISSYLVNSFDVIAIENLNVSGMLKNHKLAKSIQDSSWSAFRKQLEYKSEWYGKELRTTGRFEPTSKACSVCGYCEKNLTLGTRKWACPVCKTMHDRDINAAINILNKSAGVTTELQAWRECKTIEQLIAIPDEVSRMNRNKIL